MGRRFFNWLDERLNLRPLVDSLVNHPVPPFVNFWHCFGGLTFAVIALQVLTGMFLLIYYVPSPDHAYASVRFIEQQVLFGRLVRGLHRVGGSAAVIFVVIHMLRVYFQGAYKKPRELNWIAGVLLLITVLGFGFTGYLLPWDQRAYWATVVGTNIAGSMPLIGTFVLRVVRGGTDLGAVTLARFFAVHVWFLPLGLIILLAAHFLMVRRQGVSGPY